MLSLMTSNGVVKITFRIATAAIALQQHEKKSGLSLSLKQKLFIQL